MRKLFLFIAALCAVSAMAIEGALSGKFTVAAFSKQVVFSQGNFQYQGSTHDRRFAINQYDTIGAINANISDTYDGWIDLFGWGTGYYPTNTAEEVNVADYANFEDWGDCCAIMNGGEMAHLWRTLTYNEWNFLYSIRTNASSLRGQATVAGIHGFVLLPDNWTTPTGLTWQAMPNITYIAILDTLSV